MVVLDVSIPISLISSLDGVTLEASDGKAQIKDAGVDTSQIKDDAVTDAKADLTLVPVGTILPWLKNYTSTPALSGDFVECGGQTLSDADSVFNGQVIPDLNGSNYFILGGSTSGTTGGQADIDLAHTHTIGAGAQVGTTSLNKSDTTASSLADNTNIEPPYYQVVWIIRIK